MPEAPFPITLRARDRAMRERAMCPPPWSVFDADEVLDAVADGTLAWLAMRAASIALHPAQEMCGDAVMLELVTDSGRFVPVTLTTSGSIMAMPTDVPHRGLHAQDWRAIAVAVSALADAYATYEHAAEAAQRAAAQAQDIAHLDPRREQARGCRQERAQLV